MGQAGDRRHGSVTGSTWSPPGSDPDGADPRRDHWFEDLADHLGAAYDRYAYTKGTVQEVDHVVAQLGIVPGARVLDVGCGPGRHARVSWPTRGFLVHGIDISERFVEIAGRDAPAGATFERLDARSLPFDGEFDAVICLCQGAFGMMTADWRGRRRRRRHGPVRCGTEVGSRLSAFNAYFAVKYRVDADFDAATGVSQEVTEIRSETGEPRQVALWTGCYTPRELRLLLTAHGLRGRFDLERRARRRTVPQSPTVEVARVPRVRHPRQRVKSMPLCVVSSAWLCGRQCYH